VTDGAATTGRAAFVARVRRGAGELARFGTVGVFAYLIDVGLFNVFVYAGNPGWLAQKPLTAKILATIGASLFAYFANRQWTWRERERHGFVREYGLFMVLNAVGLVITVIPLAISWYVLDQTSALASNIAANIIGVGFGTMFRFWSYRRWVFTSPKD
jgi:putative flippase GtrA